MPKFKYKLNIPNEKTLERIKEVHFYLFIQSIFKKYSNDNVYLINIIEELASLYGCTISSITAAINQILNPVYKPDSTEIVVSSFLLGYNVRKIKNIADIGSTKYYAKLENYIANQEPTLEPRLPNHFRKEILKFLENAQYMFQDISESVKGFDIYDRYKI